MEKSIHKPLYNSFETILFEIVLFKKKSQNISSEKQAIIIYLTFP